MFLIGFVLFTIINAQTLAKTLTTQVPGITKSLGQNLPTFGPIYPSESSRSFSITPAVPVETPRGQISDSVTTSRKSIVPEKSTPSTQIANIEELNSSSWSSNIINSVAPVYRKVISYTGPYLGTALIVTSLLGIFGTFVCIYTTTCSAAFSGLNSTVHEMRSKLVSTLIPYISSDDLDSLSSTVNKAVDKYSKAQDNKKTN